MAVTQQIVRLPEIAVRRCASDVERLSDLIAYRLSRRRDTLDLDWAPHGLERLAASVSPEVQVALERVLDGTALVNPCSPDGAAGYYVYSDITWLPPHDVLAAAAVLARYDGDAIVSRLPAEAVSAATFLGVKELPASPRAYYSSYYDKLRKFVMTASQRSLALVMWWD